MIVHPDFFDHWKTKALIDATADQMAPMFVLKLWCHCQKQQTNIFGKSPNLKAICQSNLSTEDLQRHLTDAGFVRLGQQGEFIVHDWDRVNRNLRAAWINGAKGGRPTTKPVGFQPDTHGLQAGSVQKKSDKKRAGFIEITNSPPSPTEEQKKANHKKFAEQMKLLADKLRSPTSSEISDP